MSERESSQGFSSQRTLPPRRNEPGELPLPEEHPTNANPTPIRRLLLLVHWLWSPGFRPDVIVILHIKPEAIERPAQASEPILVGAFPAVRELSFRCRRPSIESQRLFWILNLK